MAFEYKDGYSTAFLGNYVFEFYAVYVWLKEKGLEIVTSWVKLQNSGKTRYSAYQEKIQAFQRESIVLMNNLPVLLCLFGFDAIFWMNTQRFRCQSVNIYSSVTPIFFPFVFRGNENEKYKARTKWECKSKQSCEYALSILKDIDLSLLFGCPPVVAHKYAKCSAYTCECPGLLHSGSESKYHMFTVLLKKSKYRFFI